MFNLRSIFLTTMIFSLLLTPANAQSQRVSCPSENFSIIAPLGWTLTLEEGDLLVFQTTSKEAVMSFKKMPEGSPDPETFAADYKNMMTGTGAKIIPQEEEMINEAKALKFNIKIAAKNPKYPDMQGQMYLFSANGGLYFFEVFGPEVITNYGDLFKSTAQSFKVK